ncbi:unnamed protein product [Moneuplotes crassus]|uniref:Uncharacterized protein n=1 Tax=Euplotes crassus TaxID=5936 RepID=A0AAD1Y381_EUPCR|nr:unnamed protein product [Moneuplotes crassus]
METKFIYNSHSLNQQVNSAFPEETSKPKGTRRLRKKTYEKINDEIRKEIILRVTLQGQKLKTVCEQLNINVSSAKNVLAIYKKEGRIEKKKYRVKRKKNTEVAEATSVKQTCSSQSSGLEVNELISSLGNAHTQNFQMNFQADLGLTSQNLNLILDNYCFCDLNSPMQSLQKSAPEQYFAPFGQMVPF